MAAFAGRLLLLAAYPPNLMHRAPRAARTLPKTLVGVGRRATVPAAALSGAGKLKLDELSDDDRRTIEERQLGHKSSNMLGCGARCKHGYPQAFGLLLVLAGGQLWLAGRWVGSLAILHAVAV